MTTYYKVLDENGRSKHGGDMQYSLPEGENPGQWHEVTGKLELCSNGLHLTNDPAQWLFHNARIFIAEYDGEMKHENSDKICVRKARLVRELTEFELLEFGVYRSGIHQSDKCKIWVWGNATVRASGNATVEAYGNATVRASGNATVRASGNATVEASGNATVEASGNATVRASDNANLLFYNDFSKHSLYGKATAKEFYGNKLYVKKGAFELVEV